MRFADASALWTTILLLASTTQANETLVAVHRQRYAMGTMFDIVAYHPSRSEAERAITRAMDEIGRLDRVLSHYTSDSDLSRLIREGRRGFVGVEPSLFEVIQESILFSRRSNGAFDVTIAPVVKAWRNGHAAGRSPTAFELSEARRCVGYEKIEMAPPDRVRFRSDCLEIDLGGIGKGYAVDRALAVLKTAGIRRALVNAGSSSIASIGCPPGRAGWPISLGRGASGRRTLLLRDSSMSTSQQSPSGEIVDPGTGMPAVNPLTISVVSPSATVSDALSTTLLLLSVKDGRAVLAAFSDVSALWTSAAGDLEAGYREAVLSFEDAQ